MIRSKNRFLFIILMAFVVNESVAQYLIAQNDFDPTQLEPKYTIAQFIPFSYWQTKIPNDPCLSGNPAIGTSCTSGTIYAGIFDGGKYMVTPGNCTNSPTPICNGGVDSLNKQWRGSTGSAGDTAGVDSVDGLGTHSSPLQRGNIITPIIIADPNVASDSAADYCSNLDYGGYTDWFLPSKSELTYIVCKSNLSIASGEPVEAPNCVQFGGKIAALTGFASDDYLAASESASSPSNIFTFHGPTGALRTQTKWSTNKIRCVRRYDEAAVDEAPNAIDWVDFNDQSAKQTIAGFDETIFLEVSAANNVGTPTLDVRVNDGTWFSFDSSTPRLIAVRANDQIDFKIFGNTSDQATITIKNATDDATTPTLDTVVATVTDPCLGGTPAIGSTCAGGALYAGVFDGGKYMVTPGNCTDSATPTCDGSDDTLTKTFRGTAGSDVDIAGIENVSAISDHSSPSFRGSVNTAAAVADASIDADSASDYCNNMTYAGHSDWYLPSKTELAYITCKSTLTFSPAQPQEAPSCTQFGGEELLIGGFTVARYISSTESDAGNIFTIRGEGNTDTQTKATARNVRCVRRYAEDQIDEAPNSVDWVDFTDESAPQSLDGFDETIFLELTAVDNIGSPTLRYQVNSNGWVSFTSADTKLLAVRPTDTVQFGASGVLGQQATITIKNATDETTKPTLDSVVATAGYCSGGGDLNTTCYIDITQVAPDTAVISGTGNIVIQNGGAIQTSRGESITIDMDGNVTIESGGMISANLTLLEALNVDVQAGASINVTALGDAGGAAGANAGAGTGGGGSDGNSGSGGGHGGIGSGGSSTLATFGVSHGVSTAPVTFGSGGGGATGAAGGDGGGAVRIRALATLTVDGDILADGGAGVVNGANASGGGAGGSIWLEAATVSGSGNISAKGPAGAQGSTYYGGIGAGGRVAIDVNNTYDFLGPIDVSGNNQGIYHLVHASTPGSIEVFNSTTPGDVDICDIGDLTTSCTVNQSRVLGQTSLSAVGMTVTSGTTLTGGPDQTITFNLTGDLAVDGTIVSERVNIDSVVNVNISGTGLIDTNGLGEYGGRQYPSAVSGANGLGGGAGYGTNSGTRGGGGAGHAGVGTSGVSGIVGEGEGGTTYGSSVNPITLGSGGGANYYRSYGGNGGGAIKIIASGTATIDGTLRSNGQNGYLANNKGGGGGSGGSVWVQADTLTGAGNLQANGGYGPTNNYSGGNGAGGYIHVDLNDTTFSGVYQANGAPSPNQTLAPGQDGTITTTISDLNNLCDSGSLAGTCTISTSHYLSAQTFNGVNFVVDPGVTLQTGENETFTFNLTGDLTVNGTITGERVNVTAVNAAVGATGSIDTTAKGEYGALRTSNGPNGYYSGYGPGFGYAASGNRGGGGGGHGGPGAYGDAGIIGNGEGGGTYGSLMNPVTLGSGGGVHSVRAYGGNGGGAIHLNLSGALTLDGQLLSDGGDSVLFSNRSGGGGAGGSIWVQANDISGSGTASAKGGAGSLQNFPGGPGGGGRISFQLTDYTFSGTVDVEGGVNATYTVGQGGLGTFYLNFSNTDTICDLGDLATTCTVQVSRNMGTYTINANNLIIDPGVTLAGGMEDTLTVNLTGDLTVNGTLISRSLPITAVNVTVGAAGEISAEGYGEWGGKRNGNGGTGSGNSPGGGGGGWGGGGGAAHAGLGGFGGRSNGTPGAGGTPIYGSDVNPITLGSGGGAGGNGYSYGGNGGGAIRLISSGTVDIAGKISVRGEDGFNSTTGGGGGAGGSLWLDAVTLQGSGIIDASGGSGGGVGGSRPGGNGAGGYISLNVTNHSFTGTLDRSTGDASNTGSVPGQQGSLYWNISNLDSLCDSGDLATTCTISNDLTLGTYTISANNLVIDSGVTVFGGIDDTLTLSLTGNLDVDGTLRSEKIDITAVNTTVSATGSIDTSELGHEGAHQSWVSIYAQGSSPGDGGSGNGGGGGGAHGGVGGIGGFSNGTPGAGGTPAYGVESAPVTMGSGGGYGGGGDGGYNVSSIGGNGGGAIKINSTNVTINGTLSAAGQNGGAGTQGAGGGAGGSIWIDATGTIAGSGTLDASGGDGGSGPGREGGGAGGGRIAFTSMSNYTFAGTNNVAGGLGAGGSAADGADGTIYPDPCILGGIGSTCNGGALYAGVFDGGRYMVTPGNCTDSATPTCDGGTDSTQKTFNGTAGSDSDIAGITEITSFTLHSSPSERGDVNTAAIVADVNIDADSAADYCNDMDYGGYTDWYLPSKSELTYISCHSNNSSSFAAGTPEESPDCVSFGGKSTALTGFRFSGQYPTSTEYDANQLISFQVSGTTGNPGKAVTLRTRCIRRFDEAAVDEAPDAINWADFNDRSSAETITGFEGTIFLEFSAVNGTGTPTLTARVVGGAIDRSFSDGSPNLLAVRPGDQIEIDIAGNIGDSATVTIKNATDNATTPTLDTVVATVSDPCVIGSPALGTTCGTGTLYAGVFDGAHYMVTPGNCTDSATPTCNGGSDTLTKTWRGTGGSNVDIAGVENVASLELHSSPLYRGDTNTAAIVADASITADSAANYCNDMTYGGFSDWYLPSKTELLYLLCKGSQPIYYPSGSRPEESIDCALFGGRSQSIAGFTGGWYMSSTEKNDPNQYWNNLSGWLRSGNPDKSATWMVRCARRYNASGVDSTPATIAWADFNDVSSEETISGFNSVIFLEFSAVNGTGTPSLSVTVAGTDPKTRNFDATTPTIVGVRSGDTLRINISGNVADSATVTVKNLTQNATTPTLDMVVATVSDPCLGGNPAIGTNCAGGAIYAGQFDGGKYMVTPGNCTDSATPTCDGGTDSVSKSMLGTGGIASDIAGVENILVATDHSSPSFRGDVNTAAFVADVNTAADSAAHYCDAMTYGGYSDWYLPSKTELAYITCKSNSTVGSQYPQEDPGCTQMGGKESGLTGFGGWYSSSTEASGGSSTYVLNGTWNGFIGWSAKGNSREVRCIRRYGEEQIDIHPDAFWYGGFNDRSGAESLTGFDDTIFLEFSATNTVGTPTLGVRIVGSTLWRTFSQGSPNLIAIRDGDQYEMKIEGNIGDQATISIKNATENASPTELHTVTATVSDPCINNPTPGTACSGGALYAGIFDGGKYMVTPGDCTNSTTPTCDGTTDTLTKTWAGGGNTADVAGAENLPVGGDPSSPSFRGDINTAAAMTSGYPTASSAVAYCANMNYGGYSDWYLPSRSEMVYLYCRSDRAITDSIHPFEDPGCARYTQGPQTQIPGFGLNFVYLTSTEISSPTWQVNSLWVNGTSLGVMTANSKTQSRGMRCVRRYDEADVDEAPDSFNVVDFNDLSAATPISGFDEVIFLEFSASDISGTPTYLVDIGGDQNWTTFTSGSTVLKAVRAGDTINLRISGNVTDSGTITIKNATDEATKPTLDTVVATVTDPCGGNPTLGTTCGGGALYAGIFDGGKYMVTPGNCTDSASPTCNGGNDSVSKLWHGTGGGNVNIAGVEEVSGDATHSSPAFRGNVNTPLIVADASINPDSAADFCNDMTYGGYSDWYLPSKSELTYILCKSNQDPTPGFPEEDPGCVQFGGETDDIGGFNGWYQTSTEGASGSSRVWHILANATGIYISEFYKWDNYKVRCIRRYDEVLIDTDVDGDPAWADFNDISTSEVLSTFDKTIFVQVSATDVSGVPTLGVRVNSGAWQSFDSSSPRLVAVRSGDTMQFKVEGAAGNSADISVVNATADFTAMWSMRATVLDPCAVGNPTIGTSCNGGAIYAGIFDGGQYMITPGNCTDSATPTCDGGNDAVSKFWRGSTGSSVEIAGVENIYDLSQHSSPSYRGDVNTSAIVADASISADSAADWCNDLSYGGYSDWYLPSKSELTYIMCKSNRTGNSNILPTEAPNCTQFGGKTTDLTGFAFGWYHASNEGTFDQKSIQVLNFDYANFDKHDSRIFRCVRRYNESNVDKAPDAIAWANFNDYSTLETISGFDETIFLEFSAVSSSGTPDYYVRVNSVEWKTFTDGSPRLMAVRSGDQIELRIVGNVTDSGTITVKNATDDATTPTLDTVVATVSDNCVNNPAIGSTCGGGAIYAGRFDGGKYMVTPGNCTDSATPTCDGSTDTLQKTWRGSTGSDATVAGVGDIDAPYDMHSSPSFRGDVNTAAIVVDASVSADSAADYCNDMTFGGYSDWYLPAKSELTHLFCKSNQTPGGSLPEEDPGCTQFGGDTNDLPSFAASTYISSDQVNSSYTHRIHFSNGGQAAALKSGSHRIRCVRRYDTDLVDEVPDAIAWGDFTGSSTTETITGFDDTIFLRLDVANVTGTPTVQYNRNGSGWVTFTNGDLIAVRASDTLQFQATGTAGNSADISVINATDDVNTPTLDTVRATVAAAGGPRRVFIMSGGTFGDFGGLAAADSQCQSAATAASLPGTFKAWLSDSTTSAASRLGQTGGPFYIYNGTSNVNIATDWADLTDGTLATIPGFDENGNSMTLYTWTFTDPDGTSYSADTAAHCNDWTEGFLSSWEGAAGDPQATNGNWSAVGKSLCGSFHTFICIEEP